MATKQRPQNKIEKLKRKAPFETTTIEKIGKKTKQEYNANIRSLSEFKCTTLLSKSTSKDQEKQTITNALSKLIIPTDKIKEKLNSIEEGDEDDSDEEEIFEQDDPFHYQIFRNLINEDVYKDDALKLNDLVNSSSNNSKLYHALKKHYDEWVEYYKSNVVPNLKEVRNIFNNPKPDPPSLPECSKAYYAKFDMEPRGIEYGERPCVKDSQCIHMTLPILFPECAAESDSQERFIGREFLLPDELETQRTTGKLPDERKLCLADNLLLTTYLYIYYSSINEEPVEIIHDHTTAIEGSGEYSRENCLYPLQGKGYRGIVGPILQFMPFRYVYSKIPCAQSSTGFLKIAGHQDLNFRAALVSHPIDFTSMECLKSDQ